MKLSLALFALLTFLGTGSAFAQEAVRGNPDHAALLASSDPKLAANKRLVYDFWREVFEAGHVELAPKYMTETYIQHNPLVASGREPFIGFLTKFVQPKPIEPKVKSPLVAILAEATSSCSSSHASSRTPRTRRRSTRRAGSTCGASRTARWRSTGTPRRSSNSGGTSRALTRRAPVRNQFVVATALIDI